MLPPPPCRTPWQVSSHAPSTISLRSWRNRRCRSSLWGSHSWSSTMRNYLTFSPPSKTTQNWEYSRIPPGRFVTIAMHSVHQVFNLALFYLSVTYMYSLWNGCLTFDTVISVCIIILSRVQWWFMALRSWLCTARTRSTPSLSVGLHGDRRLLLYSMLARLVPILCSLWLCTWRRAPLMGRKCSRLGNSI